MILHWPDTPEGRAARDAYEARVVVSAEAPHPLAAMLPPRDEIAAMCLACSLPKLVARAALADTTLRRGPDEPDECFANRLVTQTCNHVGGLPIDAV